MENFIFVSKITNKKGLENPNLLQIHLLYIFLLYHKKPISSICIFQKNCKKMIKCIKKKSKHHILMSALSFVYIFIISWKRHFVNTENLKKFAKKMTGIDHPAQCRYDLYKSKRVLINKSYKPYTKNVQFIENNFINDNFVYLSICCKIWKTKLTIFIKKFCK